MYGLHTCVIFFSWVKLTYIFCIPNCLLVIYIYCIVLQPTSKPSWKVVLHSVFLPLMLPVSPYWIVGQDESLRIFFHFRYCCYCLQFYGVVWPIIGLTLALSKSALHSFALSPLSEKGESNLGLAVEHVLETWSYLLCHYVIDILADQTQQSYSCPNVCPSIGGKKKTKQGTDNVPIWHLREERPKDASDQPRAFINTKLELKPGQPLSCILKTRECDLLTHAD